MAPEVKLKPNWHDVESQVKLVRTIIFALCLFGCLYEGTRAFNKWRRQELGTRVEIEPNKKGLVTPRYAYFFNYDAFFQFDQCLLKHFMGKKKTLRYFESACDFKPLIECFRE